MTDDDRRVLFEIVRAIRGRDEHGRFTRNDPGAVRRLEAFIALRERASREDGARRRGTLAQRLLAWRTEAKT
jgi:hypothetical protein